MFAKTTKAALCSIAIASSLIVAIALVSPAFAAKKVQIQNPDDRYTTMSDGQDKMNGLRPHTAELGDSAASPQGIGGIFPGDLSKNSLSSGNSGASPQDIGSMSLNDIRKKLLSSGMYSGMPSDDSGANPQDNTNPQDSSGVSSNDLKKLSKCESAGADDGDLKGSEVEDCYGKVFNQG